MSQSKCRFFPGFAQLFCDYITARCVEILNRVLSNPVASKGAWYLDLEARVHFAIEYAVHKGWLTYGDPYVTLQRASEDSSFCDMVRMWTVTFDVKPLVELVVISRCIINQVDSRMNVFSSQKRGIFTITFGVISVPLFAYVFERIIFQITWLILYKLCLFASNNHLKIMLYTPSIIEYKFRKMYHNSNEKLNRSIFCHI